jgi:hypothetical protein
MRFVRLVSALSVYLTLTGCSGTLPFDLPSVPTTTAPAPEAIYYSSKHYSYHRGTSSEEEGAFGAIFVGLGAPLVIFGGAAAGVGIAEEHSSDRATVDKGSTTVTVGALTAAAGALFAALGVAVIVSAQKPKATTGAGEARVVTRR